MVLNPDRTRCPVPPPSGHITSTARENDAAVFDTPPIQDAPGNWKETARR
jgi:hypothetical protein